MNPFEFQRADAPEAAVQALAHGASAKLLGGGTNLIDLMKQGVEQPAALIDINRLPLAEITLLPDGGLRLGATARNSDTAAHPEVRKAYPMLAQAILSGASAQLRNMATDGGNLLQRTRCYYFYDPAYTACNKRAPGSGCAAIHGYNRVHGILGTSEACIATNPSDMCVALAALEAKVRVRGPKGERTIAFADFHRLPGNTPQIETTLRRDELILSIDLPKSPYAAHSHYLKVRDRASYAFALVSAAAALELDGGTIRSRAAGARRRGPQAVALRSGGEIAGGQARKRGELPRGRGAGRGRRQDIRAQRLQGTDGETDDCAGFYGCRGRTGMSAIRTATAEASAASLAAGRQEANTIPPLLADAALPAKIGSPYVRVDGRAKVTGAAKFTAEYAVPNAAYGVLVTSTVANGKITRMDTTRAEKAPGVVTILTPANAPRLPKNGEAGVNPPAGRVLQLLQNADVHYNNQPIGVVVADSLDQALFAASLIDVRYQEMPAKLDFESGFPEAHPGKNKVPPTLSEGNVPAGFESAEVRIDQVYTTPKENHNPMEMHATIASWDGELLTLHDSTQYIFGVKKTVAKTLGIPEDNVRVLCPYTGGGFGSKGSTWSHVLLTAMAAKVAKRPVKLMVTRPQMFGPVGGRPQTWQHITLGAKRDGTTLTAIRHDCYSHTSVIEDFVEPSSAATRMLYEAPVITTSQKLVPLNVGTPTFQRAPGEATGTFALEVAMDELAYALKMDPIALRLKNYAESDPTSHKPFSGKNLRQCYSQGAERFAWAKRNPEPRSHREGHELIGYGMATATYPANRSQAQASVRFEPTGRVSVISGTQDLGTGTYTIMAQVAAATLGMPIDMMDAKLGDTKQPQGPVSGGSQTAASVGPAVQAAAQQAVLKLVTLEIGNPASPFNGAQPAELDFKGGKLFRKSAPENGVGFTAILARNGNQPVEAKAAAEASESVEEFAQHSWGAVFAEVGVDETLGMVRIRRIVAVYDVGTLLNEKTAKSQLIGGLVWAAGLMLREETNIDPATGRPVNNNLAEYHVPVNLDIGELDVSALGIADKNFEPLGGRGVGEIGITGAAAAIANAVYHATGKRVREAPITPDKLLA